LKGQNNPPGSSNHVKGYGASATTDDMGTDGAMKLTEDTNTNVEENIEENIAGADPSAYNIIIVHHTYNNSHPAPTTSDIGVRKETKESQQASHREQI
jgi:hypothetical protein